jgi:hypothetical protein
MENSKYKAETRTSKNHSLHEIRFKVLLFLFRIGGFPIKVKSVSRLNAAYNVILTVCFYITIFGVSVDAFVHRHNLTLAMKKLRAVIYVFAITWLHCSVR